MYTGHIMKRISASNFKARCLALLDEVARSGEPLLILKRGKPVARLIGAAGGDEDHPQHTLKGTVEVLGDIVSPPIPPEAWQVQGQP